MREINEESSGPTRVYVSAESAAEERARATYLVGGAALVGLIFLYLQFRTPALNDVDAYYHIKWSRLLWEGLRRGVFPPAFTYLPLTTLNAKDYVDHHLLFHIFLIPFTWLGDLRLGAKAAAVLFGSLGVLSCYWLILRYRIRYIPLWLLALLAASAPFLYRMSMTRAQTLSLVFLTAGICLLFEERYRWLFPLAFFFVWYYSLFVLLDAAALIWVAVVLWGERRIAWPALLWTGAGTLAGFIVNPYFPKNIALFIDHVMMKVNPNEFTASVGMEWYPYESWYFVGSCAVAFIATVIGYLFFDWEDKKRMVRSCFFLVFSTLLLIANARSRRFVEYWPPFAILFAAFTLEAYWSRARTFITRLPSDVVADLQPFLDTSERPTVETKKSNEIWHEPGAWVVGVGLAIIAWLIYVPLRLQTNLKAAIAATLVIAGMGGYYLLLRWRQQEEAEGTDAASSGKRKMLIAVIAFALCVPLYLNVKETGNTIADEQKPDAYRGGAEWLRANAPKGEMIFNTDWDDFPKLFYYDSDHAYTSGLDPTYLLEANHELSELYVNITLAKEKDPAELIRDKFGAHYVFTDNEGPHVDLQSKLIDSGWFDVVYHDDTCTVLQLLNERRETTSADGQTNDDGKEQTNASDEEESGGDDEPDDALPTNEPSKRQP